MIYKIHKDCLFYVYIFLYLPLFFSFLILQDSFFISFLFEIMSRSDIDKFSYFSFIFKCLHFLLSLKDSFTRYKIQDWLFFSCSIWNMLCNFLLAFKISDEKIHCHIIGCSPITDVSTRLLSRLFLCFSFQKFHYDVCGVDFLWRRGEKFVLFGICSDFQISGFVSITKIWGIVSSNTLPASLCFLFSSIQWQERYDLAGPSICSILVQSILSLLFRCGTFYTFF